jgi:hypothetical protein
MMEPPEISVASLPQLARELAGVAAEVKAATIIDVEGLKSMIGLGLSLAMRWDPEASIQLWNDLFLVAVAGWEGRAPLAEVKRTFAKVWATVADAARRLGGLPDDPSSFVIGGLLGLTIVALGGAERAVLRRLRFEGLRQHRLPGSEGCDA